MNLSVEMLLVILGTLTFLVSVIVEVTKEFDFLKKIKTDYYVTVLSIVISVTSYLVYISYMGIGFVWYCLVGSIVMGFLVAYLSMFGWDKLISQWKNSNDKNI